MSRRFDITLGALILAGFLCCGPAGNAWATWPSTPGGVALGRSDWDPQQYTVICPDGGGGAIIAWQETYWINPERTMINRETRVQRVDQNGVEAWGAYGVNVNPDDSWYYSDPRIVTDGAGGAFVAWAAVGRNIGTTQLRLQRLSALGTPMWTDPLILSAEFAGFSICEDGAGGVILAWNRSTTGYEILGQRVSSAGARLWVADGVYVSGALSDYQSAPVVCPDGSGGAYFAFATGGSGSNIGASHVNAAGAKLWGPSIVCSASWEQTSPAICPDGTGGAVIAWADGRRGITTSHDLYAQRVNDVNTSWWGANGLLLKTAGAGEYFDPPRLAPEPSGGALVAWYDFIQLVTGEGALGYGASGVILGTGITDVVSDGSGGAIVVRSSDEIYAHRVDANGVSYGPAAGIQVSSSSTYPRDWAMLCADGRGSAIVAYCRGVSDVGYGTVYTSTAHRIDRYGYLGDPSPSFNAVYDLPSDEGGAIRVGWVRSYLDASPDFAVSQYWQWRQVPAALAFAAVAAGARWIEDVEREATAASTALLGGALPAAGLYMRSGEGTEALYWEYAGSTPATGAASYLATFTTPSTRAPGWNPYTLVMVEARAAVGVGHWPSWPESAMAIDNIGPSAPSPFTGSYAGGTTTLQWGPHPAPDFAKFRLYRGSPASFAPGPANLVIETTQMGHVDAAGRPYYYKLTGVDVHGTEGPAALLLPDGTVGAPGEAPVTELALAPPSPNPVRTRTSVHFDLPQACEIDLALYDVSGRRRRSLCTGPVSAGRHAITWDGADDRGRPLPSGIYLMRLQTGSAVVSRKFVVAR